MTPDAKERMERVLHRLAEIDEIKEIIRGIYGEEKDAGGDKTAMGAAIAIIRKRAKLGRDVVEERDTWVETYLAAHDGRLPHTHASAHESREFPMPSGAEAGSAGRAGAPITEEAA